VLDDIRVEAHSARASIWTVKQAVRATAGRLCEQAGHREIKARATC
jgi:hypothetical protein